MVREVVPVPDATADDARVGHLLGKALEGGRRAPRVVLVGFPTDEGVRRNGGRPGAARAPGEIRRLLYRMTPDPRALAPFTEIVALTEDIGDVATSTDLEADQQRLGEVIGDVLAAGAFPIVLGGGHETAYGHFLGYVKAGRAVDLLNIDAHTDVRPPRPDGKGHSGSPFRQALEHPSGLARGYAVAGLLPHAVAAPHLGYVTRRRGKALFRDQLTPAAVRALFRGLRAPAMASFDIDAVDQGQAPGVSAPAAGGLPAELWLAAAHAAGRAPAVTSFEVVETNPSFDRDHQTARLAALTVWEVMRGLAARPKPRRAAKAAKAAKAEMSGRLRPSG
jgi:formiminoglutamase